MWSSLGRSLRVASGEARHSPRVPSIGSSLWSIPFDPVVRALVAAHPEPRGSLTAFAADLASAFLNVASGLGPLLDALLVPSLATELRVQIPTVAIANCSAYTDFDLNRRLQERIGSSALAVSESPCVRGCLSGLRLLRVTGALLWQVPHRCAPLRPSPALLQDKLVRYGMCCLSVLFFLGHLPRPDPRMARVEAAILASLCASPTNGITLVALASLRTCQSPLALRTRFVLDLCSWLSWPLALRGCWIVVPWPSCSRSAGRQRICLLRLFAHARPEALIRRYFLSVEAPGNLRAGVFPTSSSATWPTGGSSLLSLGLDAPFAICRFSWLSCPFGSSRTPGAPRGGCAQGARWLSCWQPRGRRRRRPPTALGLTEARRRRFAMRASFSAMGRHWQLASSDAGTLDGAV